MGCDGGTIPKRQEIVKNKKQDPAKDKDADRSAKWQFCALSGLRLKRPIVACLLGRLYNKDAIIEYLLDQKSSADATTSNSVVSHIKSLRNVRELTLKDRTGSSNEATTSSDDHLRAQFVCPTTGLEMNGRYKFYLIFTCGCVISERAFKQIPNDNKCIYCSKPYDPALDLIVINAEDEDLKMMKERLAIRKRRLKLDKKDDLRFQDRPEKPLVKRVKTQS